MFRLDRLDDALVVGRPVIAEADGLISLYRLDAEGDGASRVPVQLGKMSVTTVEILTGLSEGDEVILSDTTEFDEADRIRLRD